MQTGQNNPLFSLKLKWLQPKITSSKKSQHLQKTIKSGSVNTRFSEHMRHAGFELPDARMNINFSVHSSLKQRFPSSTLVPDGDSELWRFQGALLVQGKQTIWLDRLSAAIAVLTGVAAPAVYGRNPQENAPWKSIHVDFWDGCRSGLSHHSVPTQTQVRHLVMPGVDSSKNGNGTASITTTLPFIHDDSLPNDSKH